MSTSTTSYMNNRRYRDNPYAGDEESRSRARYRSNNSKQQPKRMYIPKIPVPDERIPKDREGLLKWLSKMRIDPEVPTDDEMAIYMTSAKTEATVIDSIRRKYTAKVQEEINEDPKIQLSLQNRHRYGDDIDILRATFTMSIEELQETSFKLLERTRVLHHAVMLLNKDIPKETKYRYGSLLENNVHYLLELCHRIERKYYRKNMLEEMHIKLDILRDFFYECSVDFPKWMTTPKLERMNELTNDVSSLVGGLLKSTVA